jgi:hypothetical protein
MSMTRIRITHVLALLFVLAMLVSLLPSHVVGSFMQSATGLTNGAPTPAGPVGPFQRILKALS